jgi:ATP-dependent DNA helicase RecG
MTGNKISDESYKRIKIMVSTTNGFTIAEEDLAMRGPGDMYGTRQSGVLKFKLADIVLDAGILEETREAARQVLMQDPTLTLPQHQALRYALAQQAEQPHWGKIS